MLVKPVNSNNYNRQGPGVISSQVLDVNCALKKKKFPDRNLHHISHNVVFGGYPNDAQEDPNYAMMDSRNKNNFNQFNSAPIDNNNPAVRRQQSSLLNKVSIFILFKRPLASSFLDPLKT